MGPYNHANATIGRAYGLLSQNLQGGSVPGETFMGSQGNNYTYNNLTFAENEERSPWEPLHVQKGLQGDATARSASSTAAARPRFASACASSIGASTCGTCWRASTATRRRACCSIRITARQFIDRGGFDSKDKLIRFVHETAEMPAGRYWDLQLVQNYVYPWATFGKEPMATWLKAAPDELIRHFPENEINVVVVGGETNGYWRIMGAKYRKTVSVDEWR